MSTRFPLAFMGIDPSLTSTGIAVINEEGQQFVDTLPTSKSKQTLAERLYYIQEHVNWWLLKHQPKLIVLERGFSGGQGPSASLLGAALGAALQGLVRPPRSEARAYLAAPKSRALYATGKGDAKKDDVLKAVQERMNYSGRSFDEADALVLAWLAAEYAYDKGQGFKTEAYPKMSDRSYLVTDKMNTWERVM